MDSGLKWLDWRGQLEILKETGDQEGTSHTRCIGSSPMELYPGERGMVVGNRDARMVGNSVCGACSHCC